AIISNLISAVCVASIAHERLRPEAMTGAGENPGADRPELRLDAGEGPIGVVIHANGSHVVAPYGKPARRIDSRLDLITMKASFADIVQLPYSRLAGIARAVVVVVDERLSVVGTVPRLQQVE